MKKSVMIIRSLAIFLLLLICFNSGAAKSEVVATPLQGMPKEIKTEPITKEIKTEPITAERVVVPIGPVTELPGSSVVRETDPDTSKIGKTDGLTYTLSGIEMDKYTSVYWGPQDLTAIRHSLQGALVPDRIMTLNEYLSDLPGGIGYWIGWSPSIYFMGDTGTRFKLESVDPLVLASSVNIGTTDVVLPVDSESFGVNLLFLTDTNGTQVFAPSNDYFDTYYGKTYAISGIILSSFTDAFWYTAPDVEVAVTPSTITPCLGSYVDITVTAVNNGPGIAETIVVNGTLPPEWDLISYEAPPCGLPDCYDSITGEWIVGDLLEGHISILTLRVKVIAPGLASLTETKTQYQIDSLTSNDEETLDLTTAFCSFMPTIIR